MLSHYPVGLRQITAITQQLGLQFQTGRFDSASARFYHMVLQKYYAAKPGLSQFPQNYFLFYGKQ